MKLKLKGGGHVSIGDESEQAVKIREGHDWELDERGRVVILTTKSAPNFERILPKLKSGTASMPEIQQTLAYLVERVLNYK